MVRSVAIRAVDQSTVPTEFTLPPSDPNPFNHMITISHDVKDAVNVRLTIFDVLGRQVTTLLDDFRVPGRYMVTFNASRLSAGLYFYEIKMGDFRDVKSMMLVK